MSRTHCQDLGITARRTLEAIVAFVNLAKPEGATWPTKETLADTVGMVTARTIYRGLADLEDQGYILRKRRRMRGGRFISGEIRLTQKAIVMLMLNQPLPFTKDAKSVNHTQPCDISADVCNERGIGNNPLREEPARGGPVSMATTVDRQTRLPKDLLPLVELGINPKGVSALMRQAKAKGHRLQHVVAAVFPYLASAQANARGGAFAYLTTCINAERDYERAGKEAVEKRTASAAREAAQRWVTNLVGGGRFDGAAIRFAKNGQLLGVVQSRDGVVVGEGGVVPINMRLGLAITEGTLVIRVE
jgi:hypothetical protein